MSESKTSVFVYGTLLTGQPNHRRLIAELRGEPAEVAGYAMFTSHGGCFPMLEPSSETGTVKGEVMEVSDEQLVLLDSLEGVPNLYRRERAVTTCGRPVHLYVWASNSAWHRIRIPDGDWLRWKNSHPDARLVSGV